MLLHHTEMILESSIQIPEPFGYIAVMEINSTLLAQPYRRLPAKARLVFVGFFYAIFLYKSDNVKFWKKKIPNNHEFGWLKATFK